MAALLISCFLSLIGAYYAQVLRFDVARNFVIVTSPSPVCAKLTCSINSNDPLAKAMEQPLSIWISDESNPQKVMRLAGLSSFDPEMKIFGDPSMISATGHLSQDSPEAEMDVEIKLGSPICSSDTTYSCQLHYKTKNGQFKISRVTKTGRKIDLSQPTSTSQPTPVQSPQVDHTFNSTSLAQIQSLIQSQMAQIEENSKKAMDFFSDMNTALHRRLGKIETTLEAQRRPINSMKSRLQRLEDRILSEVKGEVGNVGQKLSNVTSSISQLTNQISRLQVQSDRLETALENISAVAVESLSSSSVRPSTDDNAHEVWHTNLFGTMVEGFTLLSKLRAELMKKFQTLEHLHNQSVDLQMSHSPSLEAQELIQIEDKLNNTLGQWLSQLKTEMLEALQTIENRIQDSSEQQALPFQNLQKELLILADSVNQLQAKLEQTSPQLALLQNNSSLLWNLLIQQHHSPQQPASHQFRELNNTVAHLKNHVQQVAEELNSLQEMVNSHLSGPQKPPAISLQDTPLADGPVVKLDISASDLNISMKNLKFLLRR